MKTITAFAAGVTTVLALSSPAMAHIVLQVKEAQVAAAYRAGLDGLALQIAQGALPSDLGDAGAAAMARHCDHITSHPADATRGDIDALVAAGLSVPQIIALSELVAFINYETRIRQGHALLEGF